MVLWACLSVDDGVVTQSEAVVATFGKDFVFLAQTAPTAPK